MSREGWRHRGTRRFRYVDAQDRPIKDPEALERVRELAIPPAWQDVWISPSLGARLQATGIDAPGRKQYHQVFVENRGLPTGSWRGAIEGGKVVQSDRTT
ncbi:MAG TPA: hypothetical protein VFR38_12085 [Gaiellaceae bacterium]|nr:hypothetical protein [Gaiellaceae bacterium]